MLKIIAIGFLVCYYGLGALLLLIGGGGPFVKPKRKDIQNRR